MAGLQAGPLLLAGLHVWVYTGLQTWLLLFRAGLHADTFMTGLHTWVLIRPGLQSGLLLLVIAGLHMGAPIAGLQTCGLCRLLIWCGLFIFPSCGLLREFICGLMLGTGCPMPGLPGGLHCLGLYPCCCWGCCCCCCCCCCCACCGPMLVLQISAWGLLRLWCIPLTPAIPGLDIISAGSRP